MNRFQLSLWGPFYVLFRGVGPLGGVMEVPTLTSRGIEESVQEYAFPVAGTEMTDRICSGQGPNGVRAFIRVCAIRSDAYMHSIVGGMWPNDMHGVPAPAVDDVINGGGASLPSSCLPGPERQWPINVGVLPRTQGIGLCSTGSGCV